MAAIFVGQRKPQHHIVSPRHKPRPRYLVLDRDLLYVWREAGQPLVRMGEIKWVSHVDACRNVHVAQGRRVDEARDIARQAHRHAGG